MFNNPDFRPLALRMRILGDLHKLYRRRYGPLTGIEIDRRLQEEFPDGATSINKRELGRRLGLTLKERMACCIRSIDADVPFEVQEAAYKERKRRRDAERRRKERALDRARREATDGLDVRKETIFVLLGPRWMSLADIGRKLGDHPAWLAPNGQRLAHRSMQRAVQRAVQSLSTCGLIELKEDRSIRGTSLYKVRRRDHSSKEKTAHVRATSAGRASEYLAGLRATERQDQDITSPVLNSVSEHGVEGVK